METRVGKVTHYFSHLHVAVLELSGELSIGDTILITGHTTDLTQPVTSMEIEHQPVQKVRPGMDVALMVIEPVRRGDLVFKITD